jgi:hypothetical protein
MNKIVSDFIEARYVRAPGRFVELTDMYKELLAYLPAWRHTSWPLDRLWYELLQLGFPVGFPVCDSHLYVGNIEPLGGLEYEQAGVSILLRSRSDSR